MRKVLKVNNEEYQKQIQIDIKNNPEIGFTASEPWITVTTDDGAIVKLKLIITGVQRVTDNPITNSAEYYIQHQIIARTVKQPRRN